MIMRTGIFFFFNMGFFTKLARTFVIALIAILIFRVSFLTAFYNVYTKMLYVAIPFALIPAPSDRSMIKLIENFYQGTKQKAMDACDLVHGEIVSLLGAFEKKGNLHFCRQIGHKAYYMHAASIAYVEKSGKRVLVVGTKSLISAKPAQYHQIIITPESDLRITTRVESDDHAELTVHCKGLPKDVTLFCRALDYHYTDFLAAVKEYVAE